MINYKTIMLVDRSEIVAEYAYETDNSIVVKRPCALVDYRQGDNIITKIERFTLSDKGEDFLIFKTSIMSISECGQKVVDYYLKTVDKLYTDSYKVVPDMRELSEKLTIEEMVDLMRGKVSIQ